MPQKLSRIDRFYGGIVNNDKSTIIGAALNLEELDIFTNESYIQAETVLSQDSSTTGGSPVIADGTGRRIWGFTVDDADNLYALSDDAASPAKAKIWKLANASSTDPGNFAAFFTSAQNARGSNYASNIIWHGLGDPITTAYLYYVTGTNSLYRYGDIKGTPSESSVGTLSGITATSRYIPMIRFDGELFIGHGQFIAKVDDGGVFAGTAFTLPNEYECVDFDVLGDTMAILARNVRTGSNASRVFLWDMVATTGADDEIIIPMGGPQAIVNHGETLKVFCVSNNNLRIYELTGKVPIKIHETLCDTTQTLTSSEYSIYYNSVFVKNNIAYFGLGKTLTNNNAGIYSLGKAGEDKSLALLLSKRYTTVNSISTKTHIPLAAIDVGPNIYVSYVNNIASPTYNVSRTEENNSPSRSSNGVYESLWIDAGSPEYTKDWTGFVLSVKSMPASYNIIVDARVDNASSYNTVDIVSWLGAWATSTAYIVGDGVSVSGFAYVCTSAHTSGSTTQPGVGADWATKWNLLNSIILNSTNDQTDSGMTADRFWERSWTGLVGKQIQIKLRFTSSTTSTPQLYSMGLLSETRNLL